MGAGGKRWPVSVCLSRISTKIAATRTRCTTACLTCEGSALVYLMCSLLGGGAWRGQRCRSVSGVRLPSMLMTTSQSVNSALSSADTAGKVLPPCSDRAMCKEQAGKETSKCSCLLGDCRLVGRVCCWWPHAEMHTSACGPPEHSLKWRAVCRRLLRSSFSRSFQIRGSSVPGRFSRPVA